jgi:hypothetical protein
MDPFQQCVEDLGTIRRLLELPNGHDIAAKMFRDVTPYLECLSQRKERDPTGASERVLAYSREVYELLR